MELGMIIYENEYNEACDFCFAHNYTIKEIEANENGRRFQIVEIPQPTERELAQQEIQEIKEKLAKYKEDVEQVELFGMERADYEEKKQLCANMIVRLRELEKIVKSN